MARRKRKKSKKKTRTMQVTYPDGTTATHPDDGRDYPAGTMLVWDEKVRGRDEMRWTTVGGWPFDD